MSWALAIFGFMMLVVLHELGHFIAAKWTGMRVERFFLFFPPKVASIKRGETEYGIGAIPLGGFVKITGMNPDEELDPEVAPRAYYHQPVWKRIVVIGAGPAMNVLVCFVLLFVLALGGEKQSNTVGDIESGSPAAEQLQAGDRIISVDGETGEGLTLEERLQLFAGNVDSHECAREPRDGCAAETPATLTVERDGQTREITITPVYDEEFERNRLGFRYGTESIDGAGEAAGVSLDFMWLVTSRDPLHLRPALQGREARAVIQRRRRHRGDQAGIRFQHRDGAEAARDHQPLAGADQPVPVPAPGRRPHLLEPGREGSRPSGRVQRHGARERARLRFRADHLHDRAHERHRSPQRRGVPDSLGDNP